jgi:hypothetical protein
MTHIYTHFPSGIYLFLPRKTLNSCDNNNNNTSSSAFPAVGGVHVARLAYQGIFTIRPETMQEICPTMCHLSHHVPFTGNTNFEIISDVDLPRLKCTS